MLSPSPTGIFYFLFVLRVYLFTFREGKGEKETSMCGCLLCAPYWGPGLQHRHAIWLALTGNRTSDPSVHRPALNPLSHTIQGPIGISNAGSTRFLPWACVGSSAWGRASRLKTMSLSKGEFGGLCCVCAWLQDRAASLEYGLCCLLTAPMLLQESFSEGL